MPKKRIISLLLAIMLLSLCGCSFAGSDAGSDPTASTTAAPTATPEPDLTPANAELLYCRSLLDETMTEDYDRILNCISQHAEMVDGLSSDSNGIARIVSYVYADNPQLFWFTGGGISSTYIPYSDGSFTPEYCMSADQVLQAQSVIDARVSAFIDGIAADASDYDKAAAAFRFVIINTDYDSTLESNSIYHVFNEGRGICGCYSKATQYLLNLLGIPCVTVSGQSLGAQGYSDHAWNLLQLDGQWYWLDATWGDPVPGSSGASQRVSYDYFCVTTDMISADHTVDDSFPVPDCTATANNYYVHNGLLFDSYDYSTVQNVFYRAINAGEREAQMKFASREAYDSAVYDLFDNQRVFDIYYDMYGTTECSYYRDPDLYTLCFILP